MKPYLILGIDKTATKEQAQKAYRKLVKQHHPDVGGNSDTFKRINEAYDNFVNPPQPNVQIRHRHKPVPKNRSIKIPYTITLEQVMTGLDQDVIVSLPNNRQKLVHLQIPAGIHHRQIVVFQGLGDDSNNRLQNGDLHVIISVRPHKLFRRTGHLLYSNLNITPEQAKDGCKFRLPSLEKDPYILDIPKGVSSGQNIRFVGKGLPMLNRQRRGDLIVNITIK